MREDIANGALGLFGAAATPQLADELLSGNAETAEYGLTLTAQEALMLAQTRAEALKAANRADADAALSAVLHEPLSGLYVAGLERILRMTAAAEGLCTGLDCTALERGYVMRSLPRLAGTLERALRWGHLSAVVPWPVEEA